METIHDWNEKIMILIETMKKDHPELMTFLDEMQTLPDTINPEISIETLKEYYNSIMEFEKIH
ncbi:MAG: hypothetical protein RLZ10_2884 [Bacteroidota bacterium]|jgi:iron-sulfur cluster repair protein YtfE (RIC family)